MAAAATVAAALLAGAAAPAFAAAPPARNAAAAPVAAPRALGCLIEPDRVADVGSPVVGVVDQVRVERGDRVAAGQLLVALHAEVEHANARVAATRSQVEADVLAARANVDLARQKMERAEALVAQNFIAAQAVDQARGELEVARQRLNQSIAQQSVARQEQRVAEAQSAQRQVRSPFTGVVVERFVNLGERVEEKPVVRVAVVDPLKVELMVPSAQYGVLREGDHVTIHPELPGTPDVVATVRGIDTVLDAASNTFRVRLMLPNPGQRLPAGLRCKADLPAGTHLAANAAANAAATTAANGTAHPTRLKLDIESAQVSPRRAPVPTL